MTSLLLMSLTAYSQEDTQTDEIEWNDTLVYTNKTLMELLMSDLEQCDLDRIELKKAKAELAVIYIDMAKKESAVNQLKRELKELREYNDTITAQNLNLAITNEKEIKKLRRSKRFWTVTSFAGFLSAIAVHLNWKESYIEW